MSYYYHQENKQHDWTGFALWFVAFLASVIVLRWLKSGDDDFNYIKHFRFGMKWYEERNLNDALGAFSICLDCTSDPKKIRECNLMIGIIFSECSEYDKGIQYLNEAIRGNEKISASAYFSRSYCYLKKGEFQNAFQDISLADELRSNKSDETENKNYRDRKEEIYNAYIDYKVNGYLKNNSLYPSKVRCSNFFKTFVGIFPENVGAPGDIAYLLKKEDYEALYATLFGQQTVYVKKKFEDTYGSNTLFTYELILCSVHFLCGNIKECRKILHSPKNDLEYVFISYVESTQKDYKPKSDLLVRLSVMVNASNPTLKFWLAKVYREIGNTSMYFELMNSMKDEYNFAMADLLEYYISTNDLRKFKELEKEGLEKYMSDGIVIYQIWNYYFTKRDKERLKALDGNIKTDNALSLYMKGRYCGIIDDHTLRDKYLNDAIHLDNTYFEVLYYLAKIYRFSDNEKYKSYMNKAIKTASCRDDIVECYKDLVGIETKEYVRQQLDIII